MEQGGPSIVSSCERLAAEADGRILLGTGTNRARGAGWGCERVCPLQKKKNRWKTDVCGLLVVSERA